MAALERAQDSIFDKSQISKSWKKLLTIGRYRLVDIHVNDFFCITKCFKNMVKDENNSTKLYGPENNFKIDSF